MLKTSMDVLGFSSGSKDKGRIKVVRNLVIDNYPKFRYHNADHGIDVWEVFRNYALILRIPYQDRIAGELAALLHDYVFVQGRKDNEEKSSLFAKKYLPSLGFNQYIVSLAANSILPTKMPQKPLNLLEKLLCDADLDNLGRNDFFEKNEALRQELGVEDRQSWYKQSYEFLRNHQYHTALAKELRDEGKKRNIAKLQAILGSKFEDDTLIIGGRE